MDEHNELRTRLRAVGMELFRRDGLRFTMQQAAAMMHISKKTIYAVYPSKEALLLDMVDDAFTRIHARKQRILDGPGTLAEKLRAVIIALPEEYTALDLQQMDLLDEKYPRVAARVLGAYLGAAGAGDGGGRYPSGIPAGSAADDLRFH